MNRIDDEKHNELIVILSELIETDKDELKSLENEISDRFFFKFDVQIGTSELDNKRAELMKKYIFCLLYTSPSPRD